MGSGKPEAGEIQFNIKSLENLLRRRFFIAPSFEIYGSAAGLFDFGPAGCALKNEIESLWRRHFVLEEDLYEIHTPNLTPHAVLKTSGHVDRFLDLMLEDTVTKDCYRADKLIEDVLDNMLADPSVDCTTKNEIAESLIGLEGASATDISKVISKYNIRSPQKNELSFPYPFNLMFSTKIGPKPGNDEGSGLAYLRPETAQGIFVNFKRLLEQNGGRMPFGAACIGTSFRNEIAPRNGLLRVREFPMAEIEFFCDPESKSPFSKFPLIADLEVPIIPRGEGKQVLMKVGDAVVAGIIGNQTLAYFIARTYLFLTRIGINPQGLRFRQHLASEMAHYASDCWDAEILTSYKWVECVGIADRSAYDLTQHTRATSVDLQASRQLREPMIVNRLEARPNRKLLGPHFKKGLADVMAAIDSLSEEQMKTMKAEMEIQGKCQVTSHLKTYELFPNLIEFEWTKVKISEQAYVPNVIEPSFGIGRIIHALLEHSFHTREGDGQEERNYLIIPPIVAPIKVSILPISHQPQFAKFIESIRSQLHAAELSCKVDCSTASIGRRYARTDEIGIPFGITVDFQTVEDSTVTLREIVTMEQVRLAIPEVADLVKRLVKMQISWEEVKQVHHIFVQQQVLG